MRTRSCDSTAPATVRTTAGLCDDTPARAAASWTHGSSKIRALDIDMLVKTSITLWNAVDRLIFVVTRGGPSGTEQRYFRGTKLCNRQQAQRRVFAEGLYCVVWPFRAIREEFRCERRSDLDRGATDVVVVVVARHDDGDGGRRAATRTICGGERSIRTQISMGRRCMRLPEDRSKPS